MRPPVRLPRALSPSVPPESSSGLSIPASMRMKVVLPVPFSPSMTKISESVNSPASTSSEKAPCVLRMRG